MGSRLVIPASGVPIGSIHYFGAATPPKGFLIADGSILLRATYAKLFSVIGVQFGSGDGHTTFALPDLRGEFIRGLDMGRGIDGDGPRHIGWVQGDEIRHHKHHVAGNTGNAGHHDHATLISPGDYSGGYDGAITTSPAGAPSWQWGKVSATGTHSHYFAVDSHGTGGAETRPRNMSLLPCIKY